MEEEEEEEGLSQIGSDRKSAKKPLSAKKSAMSQKSGKSGGSKKTGGAKMEMNVEKIISRSLIN
jgi:hypothetical protein